MLTIETIELPRVMPSQEAIKSCGQNELSYDPEYWELEYRTHRYLGRVDNLTLRSRYDGIARNMNAIISDDRHVIPINSFLSSWYWFRKEHQTRLEFVLRKLPFERELPRRYARDLYSAPARPRHPNAADVLFRFGKEEHLRDMIQYGKIQIRAARDYALMERDPARKDDELVKHYYLPGEYTKVTTEDGRELKVFGDVKESISGADYFVYCTSCDWDPALYEDFSADCCVVIRNVDEFVRRLKNATRHSLIGWYFHHNPVQYFDPYARTRNEYIDNAMSKDFRFAYQMEYRFLWASFQGLSATGVRALELGPLSDIASLHMRPGC